MKNDDVARGLTELTEGEVRVEFDAGMFENGDPESKGHLFSGYLQDPEAGTLYLDDRADEPLERQLGDELRRVAGVYQQLAERLEAVGV